MITENDIIEILINNDLFKHKTLSNWRKAIAKAIIDKIKEKKFNTYKVNTKTKNLGDGVSKRIITIRKDKQ